MNIQRTLLGLTADRWTTVSNAKHHVMRVFDQELFSLHRSCLALLQEHTSLDDELDGLLRTVRAVTFSMMVTPLPVSDPTHWRLGGPEELLANLEHRARVGTEPALAEIQLRLEQLAQRTDPNPLWTSLRQNWDLLRRPLAVVAFRTRYVGPIERMVRDVEGHPIVVTSRELSSTWDRSSVAAFGPPSVYPEWMRSYPRADTYWIHHTWLRPLQPGRQVSPFSLASSSGQMIEHLDSSDLETSVLSIQEEALIQPRIDGAVLAKSTNARHHGSVDSDEGADARDSARLAHLSNGQAVWLAAHEGARVTVLDPESREVQRVGLDKLVPGWFVVLRTRSGGDSFRDLVDAALGSNAIRCRASIRSWKLSLRKAFQQYGPENVRQSLRLRGVTAEPGTIRTWLTEDVIGPGIYEWFAGVADLLDLNDPQAEWAAIREVRKAGKVAGAQLRSRLLSQLEGIDPVAARRDAVLEFSLDGVEGSKLTLFMIDDISRSVYEVHPSEINRVFDPGDA